MHIPRPDRRRATRVMMAVGAVAVAVTFGFVSPSASVPGGQGPCPTQDTWMQFHQGAAKTGWNCAEHTVSPSNVGRLVPRWSAGGNAVTGSPIVVGDVVYFVSEAVSDSSDVFTLEAVRSGDGTQVWSTVLRGNPLFPPGALAFGDGLVLLVTTGIDGGALQAFRADSGSPAWSLPVGQSRGPTVNGHLTFVGSSNHEVYALDTRTGAIRWTTTLPGEVTSEVAVSAGRVFVAAAGDLYALRASSGAVLWRSPVGDVYGGGPAVRGLTVYVAANVSGDGSSGGLFALSTLTGAVRWSAPAGDDIHSVPAVDDHNVYIGSIGSEVHAYDAQTGAPQWVDDFGGGEIWSSVASANGVLYLDTDVDNAFALDAMTGAVLWSVDLSGHGSFADMGSPAVVHGQVYVPYGGSGLIAYGLPVG